MDYSHIIEDMTWSYSRITTFEDCPYCFYLTYIRRIKGEHQFFADFGSFMHLIIQKYLNGELNKTELVNYYLINFRKNVIGKAPSAKIFHNYFSQGANYLRTISRPDGNILGVEKEVSFKIGDNDFVGYIDAIVENDGITLIDNKSRDLKNRSTRKKPTKSDKELDKYLRQLYIYSIPVENEYGAAPRFLEFNCFRSNTVIREPFNNNEYEKAKQWATEVIDTIKCETEWKPKIEWFKCKYLCDHCSDCDYFRMFGGDK